MSRRRRPADDVHKVYVAARLLCRYGHILGLVVRQLGRDMLEAPLERVDGPNGETMVRGSCSACTAEGRAIDAQIRWEHVKTVLDDIEAVYEPGTSIPNIRDLYMS